MSPQFYSITHNLDAASSSNIEDILKGSKGGVNGPSLTGSVGVRTPQDTLNITVRPNECVIRKHDEFGFSLDKSFGFRLSYEMLYGSCLLYHKRV